MEIHVAKWLAPIPWGFDCLGKYDLKTNTIWLSSQLPETLIERVISHEFLHLLLARLCGKKVSGRYNYISELCEVF